MKSHVCATLTLLGIVLVAVLLEGCAAVKLKLNAGEEECLATTLELEQSQLSKQSILTIDGALSVVGPTGKPNYNQRRSVDVVIMSPSGQELYNAPGIWKDFKFNMGASEIGTYKLCITAAATVRNAVTVAVDFFTVTHEDTAERDGLPAGARTPPPPPAELASQLHLTQVHDLVLRVGKQLERLTGEQRHFRSRLKRHMQTNQAMHGRAFMYFALEASVVLLLAAVQVTTVHAMFRNRRGNQGFLGA